MRHKLIYTYLLNCCLKLLFMPLCLGVQIIPFGRTDLKGFSPKQNSICVEGKNQSPINIATSSMVTTQLSNFTISRYNLPVIGKIENNENNLQFIFDTINHTFAAIPSTAPTITGGSLGSDTYEFFGFDWHWGSVSTQGSEHTINGIKYAAELHIYLFNKKHQFDCTTDEECQEMVNDCASTMDCVTFLAFLFQVSSSDNPKLNQFLDQVKEFTTMANSTSYTQQARIFLDSLIPTGNLFKNYYHYSGSLTREPCYEGAKWIIFEDSLTISENQLNILRQTNNGLSKSLRNNNRPTQPSNGRTISYNVVNPPTIVEIIGNAVGIASLSTGIILVSNAAANFFTILGNSLGSGFLNFGNAIAGNSLTSPFSGSSNFLTDGCPPSQCRIVVDGGTKCCRRVRRGRRLTCPTNC